MYITYRMSRVSIAVFDEAKRNGSHRIVQHRSRNWTIDSGQIGEAFKYLLNRIDGIAVKIQ